MMFHPKRNSKLLIINISRTLVDPCIATRSCFSALFVCVTHRCARTQSARLVLACYSISGVSAFLTSLTVTEAERQHIWLNVSFVCLGTAAMHWMLCVNSVIQQHPASDKFNGLHTHTWKLPGATSLLLLTTGLRICWQLVERVFLF